MIPASQRKYRFEREISPHVEPEWASEFMIELRLRQSPGEAIGAALAEVNSHCAESGDTAGDAFGPPAEYARALQLPVSGPDHRELVTAALPPTGQILGMLPLLWAVPALSRGEPVTLHTGELALLVLTLLAVGIMCWQVLRVAQLVMRRPVVALLGGAGFMTLLALTTALLREPVAELPAEALMIGGATVLLAATAWNTLRIRRATREEDVVSTPLEDQEAVRQRARSGQWAGYVPVLIMPVFAAALAAVMWAFV